MAGSLQLMQHFAGSFLHYLHLRSTPRSASNVLFKDSLNRLQQYLASYSGAPENQKQEETRIAERLVQGLYMHHTLLCNSEAGGASYVKILQTLWEFEDQGITLRSSLINDLAVRAILEAHSTKFCRSAIAASLHMETILRAVYMHHDLLYIWEEAIICGIGKSVMRLSVVELVLLDRCTSDDTLVTQKFGPLVCCIKAAFSCPSFSCDKIRQAVFEKISYSRGQTTLFYISFFHGLAEIDKVDTIIYINMLIKLLGEKKGLDMAVQTALYGAIDYLKQRSGENIYKVPYFQVFSESWLVGGV